MSTAETQRRTDTPDAQPLAVSVVMPAYNEAGSLEAVVGAAVSELRRLDRGPGEVVVVDDGSTDDTHRVARELAVAYPELRVIRLQDNFGQSAALAAGIDHARGEVIVTMDADGQNDPADIPRLLDQLDDGPEVVSGWRRDRDDPLGKRIPSEVQTRLARWTGPDIHDFGCTLTAYDADALDEVDLRGERHRYIPAQLDQLGYDIDEIEVDHHPREHGQSHYGAGRLVRGFVDLIYHLFRVRYRARPMHLFGGVGLIVACLGIGLGSWLTLQRVVFGMGLLTRLPALLLAISMTLWGTGILALGIVTELLTEVLARDERPYRIGEVVGDD